MFSRFMSIVLVVTFGGSLICLWNWIGSHFANAPAQAAFGFSSTFVGMILFFIVVYGSWFIISVIAGTARWIIKG